MGAGYVGFYYYFKLNVDNDGLIIGFPQAFKTALANATSSASDPMRALTPGGGDYMNEADVLESDWQGVSPLSLVSYSVLTGITTGILREQLPDAAQHQAEVRSWKLLQCVQRRWVDWKLRSCLQVLC